MMEPLVSVIMPVYNAERFVGEAMRSVLQQRHQRVDLLVVNDGSQDSSEEIIRGFNDERIRVISTENQGVSTARNEALRVMQGDYFCFLDADDIMPVNSITSRLRAFQQEGVAFVDGRVRVFDEDMRQELRCYEPRFKGPPRQQLTA